VLSVNSEDLAIFPMIDDGNDCGSAPAPVNRVLSRDIMAGQAQNVIHVPAVEILLEFLSLHLLLLPCVLFHDELDVRSYRDDGFEHGELRELAPRPYGLPRKQASCG
jgi:hypothetical protein